MYELHKSKLLNQLFDQKPYQGQEPQKASIIILGLDANYDADIENSKIIELIKEYHCSGTLFWKKYGVHHPFLMNNYKDAGYRYHYSFKTLGLDKAYADKICFLELLNKPTQGRHDKKKFIEYVRNDSNKKHLDFLEELFTETSRKKVVYINKSIINLSKLKDVSPFWLDLQNKCKKKTIGEIVPISKYTDILVGYHFSYCWFDKTLTQEKFQETLRAAGTVLKKYCE